MKKLVLFIAVIVAVSFASCKKAAVATDATAADSTAVVEEVVADSAATVDSTIAVQ
ncbi:MAG: hypothetical protein NTY32_06280 [Bacteroidia bacterium]|nr:hypothetical protein [Bacteroidia bacterium]